MLFPISGAAWATALVFTPLLAALACFLAPRRATLIGLAAACGNAVASVGLIERLLSEGSLRVTIGGWGAPLGIDLAADGLSAVMLLMTAVVGLGVSANAPRYFDQHPEQRDYFWPLWLLLWTALNGLFLSADVFNLYVMLELLGLSAVGLTALSRNAAALNAAMRYLFVSLLGSIAYLLGVALLYHGYGTVDLDLLAVRIADGPVATAAWAAMLAGLLLKTALFPFHFWLPPAHASAPAPVSALLSALVIKGSFYLLLRLWLRTVRRAQHAAGGTAGPTRGDRDHLGLAGSAAAAAAEAADRLFHGGPDRLSVPCLSAGSRRRRAGMARRHLPGAGACAGEGRDVPVRRQSDAFRAS